MICRRCKKNKSKNAFWRDKRTATGRKATCADCMNASRRKRHKTDPIPEMMKAAKRRAAKTGVVFALKRQDIKIPDYCPVLDIPIEVAPGQHAHGSPSIDRLDPTGGYTKDNITVISHRANTLKLDASPDELAKVFAWVTRENLRKSTRERGTFPDGKKTE